MFREGLWKGMIEKGIRGKMWRVIKNLYNEVESCVRLGSERTDWFSVEIGLRQGCILSPILFSIFIDGLAEEVKKVGGAKYGELVVSLLLFADDIVLMAESAEMLQKMLDVVYSYSKKYRFRFNKDKSNVMIFGSPMRNKKFYLGESEMQIVDSYKYLGLILDNNFSWKAQLDKMVDKARKRSRALCGMGLREGISVRGLLRGWQVLVRPVLEYGAEIWGEKKWKQGEDLQLEMGRRVLGVSKMTTKEVIQGELGLETLSSRRILIRLRFWYKIINMNTERLIYKIYKKRREEFIRGKKKDKKNWCYWTWHYLQQLHLDHFWESENLEELGVGMGKNFDKLVKEALKKKEEEEWRERMDRKDKLRTYRRLKKDLVLENYLIELDREDRRYLTMLRGGTNYLRIERGRWVGESEHERVCNVCLCNQVEDEKHFLLGCSGYARERARMFVRIKQECEIRNIEYMDEEWQFHTLIGVGYRDKNKEIRKIVINYIKEANKIRKQYVK